MTEKYRLAGEQDVDLTRHVRTPSGVRYFHKPIGSPIGGGGARSPESVSLVDALPWGGSGPNTGLDVRQSLAPHRAAQGARFDLPFQAAPTPKFKPRKIETAVGARGAEAAIADMLSKPKAQPDVADVISHSTGMTPESAASAKAFWDKHKVSKAESESLSTDLGLNPALHDKSVRELRKAIKKRETPESERAAMKTELAKRIRIAKAATDEASGLAARLTKATEAKPADADLTPVIGETLAAHPKLGILANLWDRVRLMGFDVKGSLTKGATKDEIPRIIARNVGSVLIMGLMLHLGLMVPGIGGGG